MARTLITSTNVTPLVQIITWFLLVTSISGVIARGATKAALIRSIGLDDILISVSLLFSVGQSVAVSIQTLNGFGKPTATLNSLQLLKNLKAEYAATLLYIPSLCFAKLSVLAVIRNITPAQTDKLLVHIIGVVIIAWAFTGEFAAAFQCQPSRPYDYLTAKCFDRHGWTNYFEITNVLTDMTMIALPFLVFWKMQTPLRRKASVLSFFAVRIFVVAASICKLVFWNRVADSQNPTFDYWRMAICTQTVQSLEILAACVLFLKPLLLSLESGFINGGDLRRRGEASVEDSVSQGPAFPLTDRRKPSGIATVLHKLAPSRNTTMVEGIPLEWDGGSQHSRSQIIRETRTWAVETSNANNSDKVSREEAH